MIGDPVDTLARTIWGEARGEGARGMQAVANVVMNRAVSPGWWGRDVIGICRRPSQFSCWDRGDPNLPKLQSVTIADPVFVTATEIAAEAVAGALPDIVNRATSYKESSLPWPPAWGKRCDPVAVIGHHSFYILG